MMHAYDEVYRAPAQANLGRMLDHAVNELGAQIGEFYGMFLASGIADQFGKGDYRFITGMSGVELAWEVLRRCGKEPCYSKVRYPVDRSAEYWTGWALARYQWERDELFGRIESYAPIERVRDLYVPYHEMDVRQFIDRMDEMKRLHGGQTNLQSRRRAMGLSQRELSELSGVPLRTIQQYEQRQKRIDRASAESVAALADALWCPMESLLEYDSGQV